MIGKKILSLLILSVFSVAVISALYVLSYRINAKPNYFKRIFRQIAISSEKARLDLKYDSYYIAGATSSDIFFANKVDPSHLMIAPWSLLHAGSMHLKGLDPGLRAPELSIDSPFCYIADYASRAIFKGRIDSGSYKKEKEMFVDAARLTGSAFALRSIDSSSKKFMASKKNWDSLASKKIPLYEQGECAICADGMMPYDRELKILSYVHYYSNHFISLDSDLNILYESRTIDTISATKMGMSRISSEHSITLSTPQVLVNKISCAYGGWLFISSNLIADNEDKKIFAKSSVIDVYDIKDGKYRCSFHILGQSNRKIESFQVYGGGLIAMYGQYSVLFKIDTTLF